MNKTEEKKAQKKRAKRIKIIRNTAMTLLILTVGIIVYNFYLKMNYRVAIATVVGTKEEVLAVLPTRFSSGQKIGIYLTLEFPFGEEIIRSHATVQGHSGIMCGDKVKVLFNKRKPSGCTVIKQIKKGQLGE